jgi:hypothetical protein
MATAVSCDAQEIKERTIDGYYRQTQTDEPSEGDQDVVYSGPAAKFADSRAQSDSKQNGRDDLNRYGIWREP